MRWQEKSRSRLRLIAMFWLLVGTLFIVRLLYLQTVRHEELQKVAIGARQIDEVIPARRGEVYARDARAGQENLVPLALNRDRFNIISDNRKITNAQYLIDLLLASNVITASTTSSTLEKLADRTRGYQPLAKDVKQEYVENLQAAVKAEKLDGITVESLPARFYPEGALTAHLTGFLAQDEKGNPIGRYGVEGFFDARLHGQDGFVQSEVDPFGARIPLADKNFTPAQNGDDVVLTIDRAIQFKLCEVLNRGVREYSAKSATGIIMEPSTGYILALCNVPSFDPNLYQKVTNPSVYQNNATFRAYEPGSVFKIMTMSAGLDTGKVTPDTTYVDTGTVVRDNFPIHNAGLKSYGKQTMTGVIKESLNTGAVFVVEKLGRETFKKYVQLFGFGVKTGVELKVEETGILKSLDKKGASFLATCSFGQGLTATPIQLIQAFAVVANKGQLIKPTMVYAWKKSDGTWERSEITKGSTVISASTAAQITEMMRLVTEEGHGKAARVPGYSLGGKTGTAYIAGGGKFINATNHTFIGFGPLNDPRFVMLIKYEAPARLYAESTAVPTFGEVAKFLLEYLGVPPQK